MGTLIFVPYKNEMNKNFLIVLALVIFGIATRFIFLIDGESILPNFSAIGAIAIFGATYFKGASRWMIPFAAYWGSDLVLNNVFYAQYFDSFQLMGDYWVYGAFILAGIVGYFVMKKRTLPRLVGASFAAAILFFLISNFGVWAGGTMYAKDLSGLMTCYIAGIPFFWNTLLGNLIYGFVFFGVYEWVVNRSFVGMTPASS